MGLGHRRGEGSVEEERDALRRQREEAAVELAELKRQLAERVHHVRLREQELEQALARAQKDATKRGGFRLPDLRGDDRLAAERAALERDRATLQERVAAVERREHALAAAGATGGADEARLAAWEEELAERARRLAEREAALAEREGDDSRTVELDSRESVLDSRESVLAEREAALAARDAEEAEAADDEWAAALESREHALDDRERELAERESALAQDEQAAERLARIEARLEELKQAELAFVRTQADLAMKSDVLDQRERDVARRERELEELVQAGNGDASGAISPIELEAIEARLRRLEQSRNAGPSFGAGLRQLQQRGARGPGEPNAPLH